MNPLFFTLSSRKKVMVIPDTAAHANGHPVLTYTYSIFLDDGVDRLVQARSKEDILHLEKIDDPNYWGYITFEKPGRLFNYNADSDNTLSSDEVREIIENLTELRDNPSLWKQPDN